MWGNRLYITKKVTLNMRFQCDVNNAISVGESQFTTFNILNYILCTPGDEFYADKIKYNFTE